MLNLLDRLLAPLARLLVARGIPFPELAERLKVHYVNAAKGMTDGKVTDSRLSVLTGLQRRDIARLRALPQPEQRTHHLARLLALWQTEPDFMGRDLPKNGPTPSFEALAWLVRKDIHPRTMLDALEAAGAVAVDTETQTVRLLQASYQPLAGSDDQLAYLTQNMGDHFDAATDNVLGADPAHFERAVYYGELTADQVAELRAMHQTAQMDLFKNLSTRAAAMKKETAKDPSETSHRIRAGGYFYTTKDNDA
ncbi:DUF6502 family protein [Cognatiyoonia sp. IB215182]|uniref:DUF6502 family protein n=1 Tax=Cognatiyoonia sp. IB215182 TaxID=3097353 RepID=UPI002A0DEA13|nr:DUF6502 family protein [Cognatiyoonia sp. IB215182]MDX8353767.1 DUF6502 family protein [Cognatiyoonia sp. IB215182]